MSELAVHQRTLLGLVRGTHRPGEEDDPYFHRVAASPDLQEARGNILLWRVYVLERSCVLTVALLRRLGRLDEAVRDYMARYNVSPFREFQPRGFLDSLAGDPDALLVSVSQFELAWMRVREGEPGHHEVPWPVAPEGVLKCLAEGSALLEHLRGGPHLVRVSGELPGGFEIVACAVAA